METLRKYWLPISLASAIVASLLFFGGALAVLALLDADPKYYPLIGPLLAAMVGGCAATFGAFGALVVGLLLLRFNYRNQATPLRVELYKKQCECIAALYQRLLAIYILIAEIDNCKDTGKWYRPTFAERVRERVNEYYKERVQWDIYITEDIMDSCVVLIMCMEHLAGWARRDNINVTSQEHAEILGSANQAWEKFVNTCRQYVGAKELSTGILEVMGGKYEHTKGAQAALIQRVSEARKRDEEAKRSKEANCAVTQ